MRGQGGRGGAIDTFREERGAAVILASLVLLVVLGIGAVALTARSPVTLSHAVEPAGVADAWFALELPRPDARAGRASQGEGVRRAPAPR